MYSHSKPWGLSAEMTPTLSRCRHDKVHTAQQAQRIGRACVCVCVCASEQQKVRWGDTGDFEG